MISGIVFWGSGYNARPDRPHDDFQVLSEFKGKKTKDKRSFWRALEFSILEESCTEWWCTIGSENVGSLCINVGLYMIRPILMIVDLEFETKSKFLLLLVVFIYEVWQCLLNSLICRYVGWIHNLSDSQSFEEGKLYRAMASMSSLVLHIKWPRSQSSSSSKCYPHHPIESQTCIISCKFKHSELHKLP